MTSSSRGSARGWALVGILAVSACASGAATTGTTSAGPAAQMIPPDAPRLPLATPAEPQSGSAKPLQPVELRSVTARRIAGDTAMRRLAGPRFLEQATEAIVIEVETLEPLGSTERGSSPEIYINGERLVDTWSFQPNRLVGFLSSRARLRDTNVVTVAWLGNEDTTRTRRPLTLRVADVR